MSTIRVLYNGNALEVLAEDLDVGTLTSDADLRRKLEEHFSIDLSNYTFDPTQADRQASETLSNINVYPVSSYGAEEVTNSHIEMLATVLQTPHRDVDKFLPLHMEWLTKEAYFYPRLAVWYFKHGEIRDQKELMIAALCLSKELFHRDVGCALIEELQPHQVQRTLSLISRTREGRDRKFYNLPHSVKTTGKLALQTWSTNPQRWGRLVLTARKDMKRLATGLHFRNEPIQELLFDKTPPVGSLPWVVKQIVNHEDTPLAQAQLIVQHNIPWTVASSIVDFNSPTIIAALIEVMSPQQLLNNLSALKKKGVMDNPDLAKLVNAKIKRMKKTKNKISLGKTHVVTTDASKVGAETALLLEEVVEAQVKMNTYEISKATAFFIDASGSMDEAIVMGKQIIELATLSMKDDVSYFVYAFKSHAIPLLLKGKGASAVKEATRGLGAGGATCMGAPLSMMTRLKQRVEQIVIVTDQEETTAPRFKQAYQAYQKELGVSPTVLIVWLGRHSTRRDIEIACKELDIEHQVLDYRKGEYYNLNDLMNLMSFPGLNDLAMEVLSVTLPTTGRMVTL